MDAPLHDTSPGVSFQGAPHPGVMGTAPSPELLVRRNKREAKLVAKRPLRVPPYALPPLPKGALLGELSDAKAALVASVAAQTTPPRENGGNHDIKDLTRGSRVFYPVFVEGANLSVGDLHFSQGDGEITLCGAIEMGGHIDLHVDIIPGGMSTYNTTENAIFVPGTAAPRHQDWVAFSGISVTEDDTQHYLDPYLAYQRACLHAIDYLTAFGYSREQAFLLLGGAPSRRICRVWWTSPMPAQRSISPRISSTSTSGPAATVPIRWSPPCTHHVPTPTSCPRMMSCGRFRRTSVRCCPLPDASVVRPPVRPAWFSVSCVVCSHGRL